MKIAYVSPHYAPFIGGVESHVVQIAGRVAAQGHDVTVITQQEPQRLPASEIRSGVRVLRFPVPIPSKNYAVSPSMWRYLARNATRYDVIHAHAYHALAALAAAVTKRRPLVFTPHYHGTGHSPFRKLLHPPYRRLGGLVFRRAERTIAVSPPEADLILGHFPDIRDRLVVIPNGVDKEALTTATPFPEPRKVVLSAGRIETYKQVDKTVAALAHLPTDFVLKITGDGPARADAELVAERRGLGERVTFLGRVPDDELHRWLRTATVYVSLSSNEAMPVTLIESLAAGAAVVASEIPAHTDLVKKTKGAITLVPLDAEPRVVADAIRACSELPPRPAQIETWDEIAARTVALYHDVLASPR